MASVLPPSFLPVAHDDPTAAYLNLPPSQPFVATGLPGQWFARSSGKDWLRHYHWRAIGRVVDNINAVGSGAAALGVEYGGAVFFLEVWAEHVRHKRETAYVEALWRPEWQRKVISIRGIDAQTDKDTVVRAWRGRMLLDVIMQRGSRPVGSTDMPMDEVIERVRDLFERASSKKLHYSVEAIGSALGIHRDTWYRYLRNCEELRELVDSRP